MHNVSRGLPSRKLEQNREGDLLNSKTDHNFTFLCCQVIVLVEQDAWDVMQHLQWSVLTDGCFERVEMVKFERLGVVLEPESSEFRTFAKFNAGVVLDGDVVHMVYRYSVWRSDFNALVQSPYEIDDTRYARLSPDGKLLHEARVPLISPSLAWDISGCQDARVIPFVLSHLHHTGDGGLIALV